MYEPPYVWTEEENFWDSWHISHSSSRLPLDGKQSLFYGVSRSFGAVRERSEYSPRENPIKSAYFDTTRPPCPTNHCSLHLRCPSRWNAECLGQSPEAFVLRNSAARQANTEKIHSEDSIVPLMAPESWRSGVLMTLESWEFPSNAINAARRHRIRRDSRDRIHRSSKRRIAMTQKITANLSRCASAIGK